MSLEEIIYCIFDIYRNNLFRSAFIWCFHFWYKYYFW